MNSDAILVIGSSVLMLGIALLIPGLWWAKRKSKVIPKDAIGATRVTLFGFVFSSIFAGLLILIFSLEFIAPEVSGWQRSVAFVAVLLIGVLCEKLATRLGFKLVVKNKN